MQTAELNGLKADPHNWVIGENDSDHVSRLMARLRSMDDKDVEHFADECFMGIQVSFVGLSCVLRLRSEQGRSLDRYRKDYGYAFVSQLLMIAHGQLLPDLFREYQAKHPGLLRQASKLPVEEQQALLERGTVDVVEERPDGTTAAVPRPLKELRGREVDQVFDSGRIRTEPEQVQWRKDRLKTPPPPPPADKVASVSLRGEFVRLIIADNEFLLSRSEAAALQKNLASLLK